MEKVNKPKIEQQLNEASLRSASLENINSSLQRAEHQRSEFRWFLTCLLLAIFAPAGAWLAGLGILAVLIAILIAIPVCLWLGYVAIKIIGKVEKSSELNKFLLIVVAPLALLIGTIAFSSVQDSAKTYGMTTSQYIFGSQ